MHSYHKIRISCTCERAMHTTWCRVYYEPTHSWLKTSAIDLWCAEMNMECRDGKDLALPKNFPYKNQHGLREGTPKCLNYTTMWMELFNITDTTEYNKYWIMVARLKKQLRALESSFLQTPYSWYQRSSQMWSPPMLGCNCKQILMWKSSCEWSTLQKIF